jgi:DNA repair exonuclease SbcCD ATPase subunit
MGYKVTQFSIENFMGVSACSATVEGCSVVLLKGGNGTGKTSALYAILDALCGRELSGDAGKIKDPIRHGEKKALVTVTLRDPDKGTLIVTKHTTPSGTRLEVSNGEGSSYKSPQSMLNALFRAVTIDPLEFGRLDNASRINLLLDMSGKRAELTALDAKYKTLYNQRHDVNATIKAQETVLAGFDPYVPAPEKPADVAELRQETKAIRDEESRRAGLVSHVRLLNKEAETAGLTVDRLRRELEDANSDWRKKQQQADDLAKEIGSLRPLTSPDEMEKRADELVAAQSAYQNYQNNLKAYAELSGLKATAKGLDKEMEAARTEKAALLSASINVPELTIEDGVLLVNGRDYTAMCGKERVFLGLKIASTLNPELRVVTIADGAELDAESWAEIATYTSKHDMQIFSAVVQSSSDKPGFFIDFPEETPQDAQPENIAH